MKKIKQLSKTFLKAEKIKDPHRCLALAVIERAIVDANKLVEAREWLINGDTRTFWLNCAEIDEGYFDRKIESIIK